MATRPDPQYNALSRDMSDISGRVRVMEQRYSSLRKKTQITDQSLLDTEKTLNKELKSISDEIMDLKTSVHELKENISIINGELQNAAKIHDFEVIKKYLELWKPIKFVTREEAEKLAKISRL